MTDTDDGANMALEEPLLEDVQGSRHEETLAAGKLDATALGELRSIAHLAGGIFLANASWVIVKTTDTALLGVSGLSVMDNLSG